MTSEPRVFTVPAWALETFECKSMAHQPEGAIPVMSRRLGQNLVGGTSIAKALDVEIYS